MPDSWQTVLESGDDAVVAALAGEMAAWPGVDPASRLRLLGVQQILSDASATALAKKEAKQEAGEVVAEVADLKPAVPFTKFEMGLFVVLGVAWWTFALALPPTSNAWPDLVRVATAAAGVVLIAIALAASLGRKRLDIVPAAHRTQLALVLVAVGLGVVVAAALGASGLAVDDARRGAIGVGGLAVAAFVLAITRYDTARAATALPLVVVLIGLLTFPGFSDVVGPERGDEVFKIGAWLLGFTAGVEGVVQTVGKRLGGDTSVGQTG